MLFFFFFFNDTATTEIYTLSLHDALPISSTEAFSAAIRSITLLLGDAAPGSSMSSSTRLPLALAFFSIRDRKSTRLNSSHSSISYAVFCLKKKKTTQYYENDRTHTICIVH